MRSRFVLLTLASLALVACRKGGAAEAEPPHEHTSDAGTSTGEPSDADAGAVGESVGKELPAELAAELRLSGDDADGRLVTLAPGFIATAACSDCGAPSYLWFVAVRCRDTTHCDVLTEICEGSIARDDDRFTLEFRAVEGVDAAAAASCEGYNGSFERP